MRVAFLLKPYFNLSYVNLPDLIFVCFYEVVSPAASTSHPGCRLGEEVWLGPMTLRARERARSVRFIATPHAVCAADFRGGLPLLIN